MIETLEEFRKAAVPSHINTVPYGEAAQDIFMNMARADVLAALLPDDPYIRDNLARIFAWAATEVRRKKVF